MTHFSLFLIVQLLLTLFFGSCFTYNFTFTIVVKKYGEGQYFKTIQSAIDHVPAGNNKWFHIIVHGGVYNEKVTIPQEKEYIFLDGISGASNTIISWDDQPGGSKATFSSFANNFVAKGITFMNSYNNMKKKNPVVQALAVILWADKAAFYGCRFIGVQDTLCDYKGRHYYKSCYIEGIADFIWGGGQSVFEDCNINVNGRGRVSSGFITAQGRGSNQESSGFVFRRGRIDGPDRAYLGRDYGAFSRVVFIGTEFSSAVLPLGWSNVYHPGMEKDFTYVEAGCRGKGANTSKRVPWAKILRPNSPDLMQYRTKNFIDQEGWIAGTRFL